MLVNGFGATPAADENARINLEMGYSIHFHVWDGNSSLENRTESEHAVVVQVTFELAGPEMISVLRRS
jgi:hypothetical protein